jgi:hypothetical protein
MNSKIIGWLLGLALITGCAETKTFQCQKIYEIAKEVAKETKSLTDNKRQEIDKESWLLAADKIERASEKMKNLEVNDTELQKYKMVFAQVYQDYASATREIIQVLETRNKNAARTAQDKVRRAGQLEQETGNSFNLYCKNP